MNCDIFIPIRLRSSRLPNKAMKEINGKPIIKYLIERLQKSSMIRNIVVCTTIHESDNKLVEFLKNEKIKVFRGSEKDILDRFLNAAKEYHTEFLIAVDGDDIYADPSYVDDLVREYQRTKADYIQILGVPIGFTPVGIKITALEKICRLKMTDNTETGYGKFFTDNDLCEIKSIRPSLKTNFPEGLRLSLDYQEDYELAKKIFNELGNDFDIDSVLKFLNERPELLRMLSDLELRWNEHWKKNLANFSVRDI
ncbi:MAG TPA: NTP transferase domain-containing protein [Candidatus Nitrosotalea sp.]|nr:NTP transferase domain-containing protein [Candidatus Nitrosotalea sp.]